MYAQTNMIKKAMLIKKSILIFFIALLGIFMVKGNKNHTFADKEILAVGMIASQEKTHQVNVAEKIAQQLNKTLLIKDFENLEIMLKTLDEKKVTLVFSGLDKTRLKKNLKKFPELTQLDAGIALKKSDTILQVTVEHVLEKIKKEDNAVS